MKILINRKPVIGPWGGGNLFVSSFCDYMKRKGHSIVHQLDKDIDIIFMQDPRYSDLGISINEISAFKNDHPGVKIVHRVNECDARKGTNDMDQILRACSTITDHTIFVSNWMKDYHQAKGWKCPKNSVVYNGVNIEHFAYPFGNLASFSCQALKIAQKRFRYVYSGLRGNNESGTSSFEIRRDALTPTDPHALVGAFLEGGADFLYRSSLNHLGNWVGRSKC